MTASDPVPTALPTSLRWATRLLLAEAAAVVVVVAYLAYAFLSAAGADLVGTLGVIGYAAMMTVGLAVVAMALTRRKPRARAPALVLQLLGVVVAYYLATAGMWWLSLVVAVIALVVITLLLVPATTTALTPPPAAR